MLEFDSKMTSLKLSRLAVLILLSSLHISEAAVASLYNVDPRCNVNNGVVADMNSCSNFLVCLQGRVRRIISCSQGLLYDAEHRVCNHKHKVNCGKRPLSSDGTDTQCFFSNIKVTLTVENYVEAPYFSLQKTVEAPRQSLENFLLMAAGRDNRFRFESQQVDEFGMFVTAINGLRTDNLQLTAWLPFDRFNREISIGIREYVPEDGDSIVFKFLSFAGQQQGCTGAGCRTVRSRLMGNR